MATIEGAIRVEPGSSHDLDQVMTVMEAAFGQRYGEAWTRSQCAGILPMAGVALTLAREGDADRALGFALSRAVSDEAELLLLAVHPQKHRRGIGRALLDDFVERARHDGLQRVHLEVRDGNPAIGMYRDAGFRQVGTRRNYYHGSNGELFDALTYAQSL